MEEKEEGSERQEPKRQMTIQNTYLNGIEPMSYLGLLLSDSYKGNTDDLPWLGSTKDGIARMQSEKAERKKREKLKEEHSS